MLSLQIWLSFANHSQCIERKCRHLIAWYIDSKCQQLHCLLNQISPNGTAHDHDLLIHEVMEIHRTLWLNEEYLSKSPLILRDFYDSVNQHHNDSATKTAALVLSSRLHLVKVIDDVHLNMHAFDRLDEVTKALIESSRFIAMDLVFGDEAMDESKLNCLCLLYRTCWDFLSLHGNPVLPSFDAISRSNESTNPKQEWWRYKHLKVLMEDFGLIVIHKNHIDREWKHNLNLREYVDANIDIMSSVFAGNLNLHAQHQGLRANYDLKWMMKTLSNVHEDELSLFLSNHCEQFYLFINNIFNPLITYLYIGDDGALFVSLLLQFKTIGALNLLRYWLCYEDPLHFVRFIEILYGVIDSDFQINKGRHSSQRALIYG